MTVSEHGDRLRWTCGHNRATVTWSMEGRSQHQNICLYLNKVVVCNGSVYATTHGSICRLVVRVNAISYAIIKRWWSPAMGMYTQPRNAYFIDGCYRPCRYLRIVVVCNDPTSFTLSMGGRRYDLKVYHHLKMVVVCNGIAYTPSQHLFRRWAIGGNLQNYTNIWRWPFSYFGGCIDHLAIFTLSMGGEGHIIMYAIVRRRWSPAMGMYTQPRSVYFIQGQSKVRSYAVLSSEDGGRQQWERIHNLDLSTLSMGNRGWYRLPCYYLKKDIICNGIVHTS